MIGAAVLDYVCTTDISLESSSTFLFFK